MARYGAFMRPLDVDALPLGAEDHADPLVMRFIHLSDRVSRTEKISAPNQWTSDEREAYASGDTVEFSTLRGYTEAEIAEFLEFCDLCEKLDAKYGADYAISIHHLVRVQTGLC